MRKWNRRDWLQLVAAGLAARGVGTARAEPRSMSYRADAVILLLGLPVFSRAGVGGGYAEAWPESGDEGAACFLRFAGCSWPARAHGLDRAGYIEENVQRRNGTVARAGYFGLMTRSTEETAEQARLALREGRAEVSFAAIRGTSLPGVRQSASTVFGYPRAGERDWRDLLDTARRNLEEANQRIAEDSPGAANVALPTFLYSLRRACQAPEARLRQAFVYGDRQWWLDTEKIADPRMARELAAGGPVFRLTGAVRKRPADSPAVFRIWFEAGHVLPLRIDYQPRTFLRLTFVRDTQSGGIRALPAADTTRG